LLDVLWLLNNLCQNAGMPNNPIDLSSLGKALAQLEEALLFWHAQVPDAPLAWQARCAMEKSHDD
jgi:hypothetical protein